MTYYQSSSPVIVFDIETVPLPPDDNARQQFEAEWEPPSNYKDPEKIAAKKEEDFRKFAYKGRFKVYGATIVSCAMAEVNTASEAPTINEQVFADRDERKVATFFAGYLQSYPSYRLCGFNINNFDMLHIARALHAAGQSLEHPVGKWDTIDLYQWPLQREYSLANAARGLAGVEKLAGVDGSMIEALVANDQWDRIKDYNMQDVRVTAALYKALSRVFKI